MRILKLVFWLLCLLPSAQVLAWNALGHQLVAQIAYDHMTPQAKNVCDRYNHAMDRIYRPQSWVNAAVWLDTLRYQDINWFSSFHYIDIPFSEDGSLLPAYSAVNAVSAIENAKLLLVNKYPTDFDKGTALRILIHVVGDIHQPLHTATRVTAQYPQGDRGGNMTRIYHNRVAKNLHAYWDRGAGFLTPRRRLSQIQIEKKAASLEKQWPCSADSANLDPMNWAKESHYLAISYVYKKLPTDNIPDKNYQVSSKKIVAKQLALAGCRLSTLLNNL